VRSIVIYFRIKMLKLELWLGFWEKVVVRARMRVRMMVIVRIDELQNKKSIVICFSAIVLKV
jgi:hypothetical protein